MKFTDLIAPRRLFLKRTLFVLPVLLPGATYFWLRPFNSSVYLVIFETRFNKDLSYKEYQNQKKDYTKNSSFDEVFNKFIADNKILSTQTHFKKNKNLWLVFFSSKQDYLHWCEESMKINIYDSESLNDLGFTRQNYGLTIPKSYISLDTNELLEKIDSLSKEKI